LSKSSSSSAANPASATDVAVDATAARKTKGDTSSRASSSSSSSSAAHRKLLSEITVGTRLAVYWPDDDEHYPCTIRAHRPRRGQDPGHLYELHYEDGEVETIDLARERFRVIGGKKKKKKNDEKGRSSNDDGGDGKEKDDDIDVDAAAGSSAKKRRRILQESSEEDEFDELDGDESEEEDDDDDSGSEYQIGAGEDSADDSLNAVSEKDDWMESEEEEDAPKKNKKRAVVRKITVARTDKCGAATDGERFVSPTPMKSSKGEAETRKAVVKDIDFSSFLSQSPSEGGDSRPAASARSSVKAVTQSQNSPIVTNDGKGQAGKKSPPPPTTTGTVPKPVPGAVNQAGSHTHNHLKFFTSDRRDANRNPADHPCFSPRTLFVDHNELARHQESGKVTAAQRQWWDIKSQYADTVLLFKTGKFYEMFHDDADVGVSVLGFVYMKGTAAHAGFPEGAYGTMVSRLVQAGYKVARVEQTETPDALQERKKRMPKGHKKPEVVCREVCSVVSKGTRTFCYLDDVRLLESGEACTGPLVVIKETLVEDGPGNKDGMDVDVDDGEAGTKAICEYGVTIVDAVTGVVTLGQFADDVLRSRMQTLLARFGPSEVSRE
jgi:DNA mismatch repair protein MSH6